MKLHKVVCLIKCNQCMCNFKMSLFVKSFYCGPEEVCGDNFAWCGLISIYNHCECVGKYETA